MSESWRIVLLSTVAPAIQGLDALSRAAGHRPVAVVTAQGPRGRFEAPPPDRREFFNRLIWETPPDLDITVAADRSRLAPLLEAFEPDLVLCLGFPWRVPKEALAVPRLGCVNGHPSLLPRHRGPAPLAWAVRSGDAELGLTYHRMDADFDTGPVLAQGSVPLGEDDWMPELQPKLAELSAHLVPRVFERLAAGDAGDSQEGEPTYAGFFDDDYRYVDWTQRAADVHRQVRAWSFMFGHAVGPLASVDGETFRIVRTRVERGVDVGRPGEVVRRDGEAMLVRCGDDALWLLEMEAAAETSPAAAP